MKTAAIIISASLLLAACGDGPALPASELGYGPASVIRFKPPLTQEELVGDWLFCEGLACRAGDGVRFQVNGEYRQLSRFQDEFGETLGYCVLGRDTGGRFELVDQTIQVTPFAGSGEAGSIKVKQTGAGTFWILTSPGREGLDIRVQVTKVNPPQEFSRCSDRSGNFPGEPPVDIGVR